MSSRIELTCLLLLLVLSAALRQLPGVLFGNLAMISINGSLDSATESIRWSHKVSRAQRWLTLAASAAHERSQSQLQSLSRIMGSDFVGSTPNEWELALLSEQSERWGLPFPESLWDLMNTGEMRLQAEDMRFLGAPTPNQFTDVKTAGEITFAVLYWQHNYLQSKLMIPQTGRYQLRLRVIDWPPVPLQLVVDINGNQQPLVWKEGDMQWKEKSTSYYLPQGMNTLSIFYVVESSEGASQVVYFDYLDIKRLE